MVFKCFSIRYNRTNEIKNQNRMTVRWTKVHTYAYDLFHLTATCNSWMHSKNFHYSIYKLQTFTGFDYPETIVTDNTPNLSSINISPFWEPNGIWHLWSICIHCKGNAEIVQFYPTQHKAIRTMHIDGWDWQIHIFQSLLIHRNTLCPFSLISIGKVSH